MTSSFRNDNGETIYSLGSTDSVQNTAYCSVIFHTRKPCKDLQTIISTQHTLVIINSGSNLLIMKYYNSAGNF